MRGALAELRAACVRVPAAPAPRMGSFSEAFDGGQGEEPEGAFEPGFEMPGARSELWAECASGEAGFLARARGIAWRAPGSGRVSEEFETGGLKQALAAAGSPQAAQETKPRALNYPTAYGAGVLSPRLALVFRLNRAAHFERANEAEARERLFSASARRVAQTASEGAGFERYWAAVGAGARVLEDFRAFGPGSATSALSGCAGVLRAGFGDFRAFRAELLNRIISGWRLPSQPESEGLRLLLARGAPDARACVEPLDLTSFKPLALRIPADVQVQHEEPSMVSFSSGRTRRRRRGADLAASTSSVAEAGAGVAGSAGNESDSRVLTFADFSVEIPARLCRSLRETAIFPKSRIYLDTYNRPAVRQVVGYVRTSMGEYEAVRSSILVLAGSEGARARLSALFRLLFPNPQKEVHVQCGVSQYRLTEYVYSAILSLPSAVDSLDLLRTTPTSCQQTIYIFKADGGV